MKNIDITTEILRGNGNIDLLGSKVGGTKKLLIYFANITSYPVNEQYESDKNKWMLDSTAHLCMTVDTHLRDKQLNQASTFSPPRRNVQTHQKMGRMVEL